MYLTYSDHPYRGILDSLDEVKGRIVDLKAHNININIFLLGVIRQCGLEVSEGLQVLCDLPAGQLGLEGLVDAVQRAARCGPHRGSCRCFPAFREQQLEEPGHHEG